MKKLLSCLALALCLCPALQAQNVAAKTRLSPFTQQYLLAFSKLSGNELRVPDYVYKKINNQLYVSALIKVDDNIDETALSTLGVHIGTRAGKVWTAQIPAAHVAALTNITGLSYVGLDMPVYPAMDSARKQTHADSAQKGINLPMPVTGKNVVVGIIDAGFDYNHHTLFDTANSAYRVRKVWAQKTTGTPPSGFIYGNELVDSNAIKAAGYDTAITSHGTHVAGIAAGSGYGSNGTNDRYRGMAFESDLVLVGIMPEPGEWIAAGESDIIDGMSYIFTYAATVGKPAVVNLSWGSTLGPHDGYSLFSEACDALTGPGKIFVCAAGNNGQDTVHLQKSFTATDTSVSTFVTFSPYLDTNNQRTWVDVWGDTGKTFCFNVRLFSGAAAIDSTGFICLADTTRSFKLVGSNGDTCYVDITGAVTEYNGKPHAYISLYSKVHDNICLTTKANDGVIDMWEGYVYPPVGYYGYLKKLGYPWAVSGDVNMTVSDIGCTRSAVTVGAYTSKTRFTNINGANLSYPSAVKGRIAPFSSFGPTSDYRVKPDITAPGFALASAVSSYDSDFYAGGSSYNAVVKADTDLLSGRIYRYAMLAGTSMASPCASGIIAMMLQVNPNLTPDETKIIINNTAITDGFTGVLPPSGTNTWGHGKINAYSAVSYLIQKQSVSNNNMDPVNCFLYPNPNKGGFTIDYVSKTQEELTIEITDITGKLISKQSWPVSIGSNSRAFSGALLTKGIYFTKVSSKAGYNVIKMEAQ